MQPLKSPVRNNFDLVRILASLQVLLGHGLIHFHLAPPVWWPIVSAFPSVPIFFVISGYLISKSYERSPGLAGFARNRLLKIYPALWTCILLTVVVASAAGFSFLNRQAALWIPTQMAGLIYTPAFLKSFGFGSYNGSLWTIPVELQFYIVLPMLYAVGRRWPASFDKRLAMLLVVCIGIALAFGLASTGIVEDDTEPGLHKLVRYTFLPHIYLYLAGILMRRLELERSPWIVGKGLYWLAVYLAFHFALPMNAYTELVGNLMLAVCVVAFAFSLPGLSQRVLRGNDLSYGVYVYHGLLINIFLLLGWQGYALMPLLVVLSLVAATISWRVVEEPFLRLKARSIRRVPPGAPVADAMPPTTSSAEPVPLDPIRQRP